MTNKNLTGLALFGMLLVVVTVSLLWHGTTANATATATGSNYMTGAKFLFIQSAQSDSVSKVNATTSTLELSDVSDKTIMFADRPERIVTSENTTDFIDNWGVGGLNSFAASL